MLQIEVIYLVTLAEIMFLTKPSSQLSHDMV